MIVRVSMNLHDGPNKELQLFTAPSICGPLTVQPISLCVTKYDHLSHIEFVDLSDGISDLSIDILIGADYYWDIVTGEIKRGREGPIAIHTKLRWVLSGPALRCEPIHSSHHLFITHALHVGHQESDTEVLKQMMQALWNLESLGVVDFGQSIYTDFIQFKNGPYEGSLLWKDPHVILPDNYQLCAKRLHGLLQRLRQDPAMLQKYDSVIKEQIEQGIVEVVPNPDLMQADKVYYLPHHEIIW